AATADREGRGAGQLGRAGRTGVTGESLHPAAGDGGDDAAGVDAPHPLVAAVGGLHAPGRAKRKAADLAEQRGGGRDAVRETGAAAGDGGDHSAGVDPADASAPADVDGARARRDRLRERHLSLRGRTTVTTAAGVAVAGDGVKEAGA